MCIKLVRTQEMEGARGKCRRKETREWGRAVERKPKGGRVLQEGNRGGGNAAGREPYVVD